MKISKPFPLITLLSASRRLMVLVGLLLVAAGVFVPLALALAIPTQTSPASASNATVDISQDSGAGTPYCQLAKCFRTLVPSDSVSARGSYCQLAQCFREKYRQDLREPQALTDYCQLASCFAGRNAKH